MATAALIKTELSTHVANVQDETLEAFLKSAAIILGDGVADLATYDYILGYTALHMYELATRENPDNNALRGGLRVPGAIKRVSISNGPTVEVLDLTQGLPAHVRVWWGQTQWGQLALGLFLAAPESQPFPMVVKPSF